MSSQQQQQNRRPNQPEFRRVDFICKTRYGNQLPDLPFEPKFLQPSFVSLSRFVDYKPTSLEKNYKYELLTESDLNVKIDLIDPMTYYFDPDDRPLLQLKDEKLLEDESVSQQNFKRSQQHSKVVPFMRKTEYISTEFNRYGVGAERQESKIGYGTRKKFATEQSSYKDRDSQMIAIERTFQDVKKPATKHYSKPGVYAVSETPVLPDFDMWGFPFAQVVFDSDPLPICKHSREERLSLAVLRGMMDTDGNQFVGYFSPVDVALAQKAEDGQRVDPNSAEVLRDSPYKDGYEYEYRLEREYMWTVKNKATAGYEQENYFFVMRGNFAYYNELESRVRLVRRPKSQASKYSLLFVKYRPSTSKEAKSMDSRVRHLLYPLEVQDDDEEEEEEEEEEEREEEPSSQESNRTEEAGGRQASEKPTEDEDKDSDEDSSDDDEEERPSVSAARQSRSINDDDNEEEKESQGPPKSHVVTATASEEQSDKSSSDEESEEEEDNNGAGERPGVSSPTHNPPQPPSDLPMAVAASPVVSSSAESSSSSGSSSSSSDDDE